MEEAESKAIAGEILQQLGGKKFVMMTGAKNFYCDGAMIGFKIGRNPQNINCVKISLNGLDLYDMKFENVRMSKKTLDVSRKVINEYNNVYGDQIQELFTQATGLNTRLF